MARAYASLGVEQRHHHNRWLSKRLSKHWPDWPRKSAVLYCLANRLGGGKVPSDLDELMERLAWCRTKTAAVEKEILLTAQRCVKHRLESWGPGAGQIFAQMIEGPPVSLRSEIGMIVNEQRAVLDALACTLARRGGANTTKDVYFPVTKDRQSFYEPKGGKYKIRRLSQADQDKIERIEPWYDPNGGNLALYLLHQADITRKHDRLLKWSCLGGVMPSGNGHIGHMTTSHVIFDEIGVDYLLAHFNGVTCDLEVNIQLIYAELGALNGNTVIACLHVFDEAVTGVVDMFL